MSHSTPKIEPRGRTAKHGTVPRLQCPQGRQTYDGSSNEAVYETAGAPLADTRRGPFRRSR
ncbi:hypothetical protein [Streptomyces noursei]|uniref:hypothetical protein n=1 Tax=Streptomyces noursei TaxID=1971 RepID=UPI0037F89C3E